MEFSDLEEKDKVDDVMKILKYEDSNNVFSSDPENEINLKKKHIPEIEAQEGIKSKKKKKKKLKSKEDDHDHE